MCTVFLLDSVRNVSNIGGEGQHVAATRHLVSTRGAQRVSEQDMEPGRKSAAPRVTKRRVDDPSEKHQSRGESEPNLSREKEAWAKRRERRAFEKITGKRRKRSHL